MSAKKKSTKNTPTAIDYSKLERDTRLIPLEEWDWTRVVYSEPQRNEIPDGSGHYRRVRIQYMYDDKTIGPAIVELGKHYCYGVQADNLDKDGKVMVDKSTGKEKALRGYRVPIVMTSQNKNTPNPEDWEQREVDFFDDWRAEVIRYATENKKAIGKGAKKDDAFDSMVGEILYRRKDEDGNITEGVAPKLYGNLIYYSNKREVGTTFYGPGDKEVNPLHMTGHFHIYPTIRFDSIFVGGKSISLQHRVYDATVEPISRAPKKRLARPNKMTEEEAQEVADEDDGECEEATGKGDVNDMMESEDDE